ncbi:carbon-nitrogen hydrolase [Desulforhabdus amnigena]|uniref:Carbon-nitrogen hydrolase n=2 Tax=Desulforhabdus amnigena TaxID=40218 RepID=A0A9W6FWB1_9BACT|nr:carbon-nitrogen hydrolase [Desulforhabdus amnigena]
MNVQDSKALTMKELVVGCSQLDVLPGNIWKNVEKAERLVSENAEKGCRLLIFPEMWSCSFVYSRLREMAETTPHVLERFQEWGRRNEMVLVGSLPERDGDAVFNSSYVIDRTGEIVGKYRKIHLFSYNREHEYFGRGEKSVVCSTSVGRLGIMICYDLRFPELARRLALDGAEILCISALWPTTRINHWSLLLRSRALENQMFVMGCNGCGKEQNLRYGGASAIVSPTGELLAEGKDGEEQVITTLDQDLMTAFRRQIPCFEDRLPGAYNII